VLKQVIKTIIISQKEVFRLIQPVGKKSWAQFPCWTAGELPGRLPSRPDCSVHAKLFLSSFHLKNSSLDAVKS